MSLQDTVVELDFASITDTRSEGTIDDLTVYTSPARNILDGFLSGNKMKYDSSVNYALTITPNTNDPKTVSSWQFDVNQLDGWYQVYYVLIAAYNIGTTYALYDAVYDTGTNLVYRSLQNSNLGQSVSNVTWWEPITSPSTLASNYNQSNKSNNIASTVFDFIVPSTSEYAFANQISVASSDSGTPSLEKELRLQNLLSVLVNGLYVRSDRLEMSQGEKLALRIRTIATENDLL